MAITLGAVPAAAQRRHAPAPPAPADPFAAPGWHLELTGHGAVETWNYNVSHETMGGVFAGFTYGVRDGLVFRMTAPLYYVVQRGTNAYLFGITWGVRGRWLRKPRWSAFWEFEVGASEADTYTPPGGTRFNYLAIGGGGVTVRVRPGVHALGGLRWVHVSNNSLAGRNRNPDIEAVGPTLGLLVGF
jgi:hypothetical protein